MSRIDAALLSLMIVLLFLLAFRPVAIAAGLVDRPGGRKAHIGIVPVIGGLSMWLTLAAILPLVEPPVRNLGAFLLGSGLLVLIGVIDDRFDLRPSIRLIAQAAAALVMCLGAGLIADSLGNIFFFGEISLGILSLPFTVLVTISVINAFNMMDGMDGLAGGMALASLALILFLRAVTEGSYGLGLAFTGCAVVAGFLVFNFPIRFNRPVRTFMGDAGSTFLGFLIVWLGLTVSTGPEAVVSPVVALYIAALPIFDLFITFGRRLSKGQSPFSADREHFHHILLRAGFSERIVLAVMVGGAFLVGAAGVTGALLGVPDGILFLGLICIGGGQVLAIRRAWRLSRWLKRRRKELAALGT